MDKRIFPLVLSVKKENQRQLFEASPASLYGGQEGLYRVRINRRWHNTPDGKPLFMDMARLLRLVQSILQGEAQQMLPVPHIPCLSRVSVRQYRKGMPYFEGGRTVAPPIRTFDGHWMVAVSILAETRYFPVENVIYHEAKHGNTQRTSRYVC